MLRERKIPETAAASEAGSQSATRRPPRRPLPSDTTLVCQANQHAHAHKHTPQGCEEKAALLAGWLALAISWSGLLVGWLLPSWRRNWCQRDGAIVVLYAQDYKVAQDF